jgi:hypothetical protein
MDALNQIGPTAHQDVRAILAAEVILCSTISARMNAGSHRTVKHHDATI